MIGDAQKWLISTPAGNLILGIAGSILAPWVVKLAKLVAGSLFGPSLKRMAAARGARIVFHQALMRDLGESRSDLQFAYTALLGIEALAETAVFTCVATLAGVYWIVRGLTPSWTAVVILVALLYSGAGLVMRVALYAAAKGSTLEGWRTTSMKKIDKTNVDTHLKDFVRSLERNELE